MARQYAKLYLSVWSPESDFRKLSGDAQRLYFLLVSSPRLSSAGCCVVQPRRWALQASDTKAVDIESALAEHRPARVQLRASGRAAMSRPGRPLWVWRWGR